MEDAGGEGIGDRMEKLETTVESIRKTQEQLLQQLSGIIGHIGQ